MEWVSIVLCSLTIFLAISSLAFCRKLELKIVVFLIVLANVGIIILGRNMDNFTSPIDLTNFIDNIKNFSVSASELNELTSGGVSNNNADEIIKGISNLNDNIKTMQEQLSTAVNMNQTNNERNINFTTSDNVLNDVETYKAIQMARLNDLQTQLLKTQQLASAQANAAETNKYKPIKIYSSCIVSNADGSYST